MIAVSVTMVLIVLTLHPESRFYPACPIRELLHVQCPGCGATRALTALLQGRWRAALEANALFVFALPWMLSYAGLSCFRALGSKPFLWPEPKVSLVWPAIGLTAVFTVARNFSAL